VHSVRYNLQFGCLFYMQNNWTKH